MNKKLTTKDIAQGAVFAAVYVALTLVNPLSFGAFQFRIAAVLSVLPLFLKRLKPAGILAVGIANLWSPFGIIDVAFGCSIWIITYYLLDRLPVGVWVKALLSGVVAALLVAAEIVIMAGGRFLILFLGILVPQEIAMAIGCLVFPKLLERIKLN